jgi:cell division septation protein DedD
MSRVFEALTAAVYEHQHSPKRELSAAAVEGDLIARSHRVLKTEPAFTEAPSRPDSSTSNEETPKSNESEHDPDRRKVLVNEHAWHAKGRDFHFKQAGVVTLLAAVASIMAYVAIPIDYTIDGRANSGNTTYSSRQQNGLANQTSNGPGRQTPDPSPVKPELPSPAANDDRQLPGKLYLHAQNGNPKTWSVQVSATVSEEPAGKLAQQLGSEGYAVYVIQAEVKGQRYHRVRIGPFSAREEAEPVLQLLSRDEAYRDAYLAND